MSSFSSGTPTITTMEREGLAGVCVLASLADGAQNDQERAQLQRALSELGEVSPSVFQRAMMGTTTLEDEARKIVTPELRELAFQLAVGVCDSDGVSSPREKEFLTRLAGALNVPADVARQQVREADELVDLATRPAPLAAAGAAAGGALASGAPSAAPAKTQADKDADSAILTYAMINGALELLPQSVATFAIIPLQTRMVYKVGTLYGYKLDSGHIKEFIATAGLGLGGQFVENTARKFLSGLAGRYLGRTAGKIVEKSTGPMMTFATTYALGQAAKAYYAGGRTLSVEALRRTFAQKVDEAKGLYASKEPEIRAQASRLSPSRIMELVRGA